MTITRQAIIVRNDGIRQRYKVRVIGDTFVNSKMIIYKQLATMTDGTPIIKATKKKAHKTTIITLSANNKKLKRKAFKINGKYFDLKGRAFNLIGTFKGERRFKRTEKSITKVKLKKQKDVYVEFHWVSGGKMTSPLVAMKMPTRSVKELSIRDEAQRIFRDLGIDVEIDQITDTPSPRVKYRYNTKLDRI